MNDIFEGNNNQFTVRISVAHKNVCNSFSICKHFDNVTQVYDCLICCKFKLLKISVFGSYCHSKLALTFHNDGAELQLLQVLQS